MAGVSLGRDYAGPWQGKFAQEGMRAAASCTGCRRSPSAGMAFYSGDKFPAWRGNVIVGSMRFGEIPKRATCSASSSTSAARRSGARCSCTEFRQRVREVRQGPDGFIYILTDETQGGLFRLEPS